MPTLTRKLYIFDLGGVLLLDFDTIGRMADVLSIPREVLEKDYNEYEKPMIEGFMSTDDYYRHLELHFGVKVDEDLFSTCFQPFTVNSLMLSLADGIRAQGGRCVIGSNTFAPHWPYLFSSGVGVHFDAHYASHLMNISKPDPEFWLCILEREGYQPEEAVFIDDNAENIAGAASVGIDAFHYTSDEGLKERFSCFLS